MRNVYDEKLTPARQTKLSAGYDIAVPDSYVIQPRTTVLIDTGIVFEDGDSIMAVTVTNGEPELYSLKSFFAMIMPRSSLGFAFGLKFNNTVPIIDSDYRDTIKLECQVDKTLRLEKGDRIAQLIFLPFYTMVGEKVPVKERTGGIGSTGRQTTLDKIEESLNDKITFL